MYIYTFVENYKQNDYYPKSNIEGGYLYCILIACALLIDGLLILCPGHLEQAHAKGDPQDRDRGPGGCDPLTCVRPMHIFTPRGASQGNRQYNIALY